MKRARVAVVLSDIIGWFSTLDRGSRVARRVDLRKFVILPLQCADAMHLSIPT